MTIESDVKISILITMITTYNIFQILPTLVTFLFTMVGILAVFLEMGRGFAIFGVIVVPTYVALKLFIFT